MNKWIVTRTSIGLNSTQNETAKPQLHSMLAECFAKSHITSMSYISQNHRCQRVSQLLGTGIS